MNSLFDGLLNLWQLAWVLPRGESALELAHPLVLALAPLPLLLTWRMKPYVTRVEALHAPFFAAIMQATGTDMHDGELILRRRWLERAVGILAWLALVVAATQPAWVDPPKEKILPARDLLLAIDISQSMDQKDFPADGGKLITRFEGVRQALDEFITRRSGDRLGLLVFANGAHLAVPFTLDHALLHELMAQTRTGMAGPRTMIGDAIGLGIRVFDASRAQANVMILLTDGADTGSRIPPDTAARIAREHDITIHTIAIGTPTATGTDRVDTATLKSIAQLTGGRAALASRFGELQTVYAALDALETANHTRLTHRTRHPLFHWPLGFAVPLLLLWQLGEAVRVFATDVRAKRGVVVDVVAGEPRV